MVTLGYGVVAPVLPQYARNFGVGIGAVTVVIAAFSLARLCFAPVVGLAVQWLGERQVYISALLSVSLSTSACAFAQTYWQLLLVRLFAGIGSIMFVISSLGLMIRISPAGMRGRIAGMMYAAFLAGSIGGQVPARRHDAPQRTLPANRVTSRSTAQVGSVVARVQAASWKISPSA